MALFNNLCQAIEQDDPAQIKCILDSVDTFSAEDFYWAVGTSPLGYAIDCNSLKAADAIIDMKIPIYEIDEHPLEMAIEKNLLHLIAGLIESDIDLNQRLWNGETFLMHAASYGSLKVVEMLIDAGANVSIIDYGGRTAASIAKERGDIAISKVLKSIELQSPHAEHPLEMAIEKNLLHLIAGLIESDIDLNQRLWNGETFLMRSAFYRNLEAVEMLIDAGADVSMIDDSGRTAASIAKERGDIAIFEVLKAAALQPPYKQYADGLNNLER